MPQFSADEAAVAAVMQQAASTPPAQPEATTPSDPPAVTEEPEKAEVKLDYREFDPKHRDSFTGLLFVGHLDEDFELFGHRFVISSPTQTERLQIGPVIKEFSDTITGELAYQAAMVAAYLKSVDGKDLPQPILTNARDTALRERFNWVTDNLRRPVINAVSDRCMMLEAEIEDTLDAMGKAQA
jgi:hypothetical protein